LEHEAKREILLALSYSTLIFCWRCDCPTQWGCARSSLILQLCSRNSGTERTSLEVRPLSLSISH